MIDEQLGGVEGGEHHQGQREVVHLATEGLREADSHRGHGHSGPAGDLDTPQL